MNDSRSLLLKNLIEIPSNPFITWDNQVYTFETAADLVVKRVVSLQAAGIQPGDRLVCLLPNSLDWVILMLACIEMNVVFAPLPNSASESEIAEMCRLVNPKIVVSLPSAHQDLSSDFDLVSIDNLQQSFVCNVAFDPNDERNDDIAVILFTSGSTGLPKPVALSLDNFRTSSCGWNSLLKFTPKDHYLTCLPLAHAGGISILFRAMIYGFQISLMDSFSPEIVSRHLSSGDITVVSLVPTMLHRIIQSDFSGFHSKLRAIILGGGPIPADLIQLCLRRNIPTIISYGMTETCSGIAGSYINDNANSVGAKPFPNVDITIFDDEICVSGPMVADSYWSSEKITQPFHTGDFGKLDETGCLHLNMRRVDRIVTGGENVSPREIEQVLLNHPDVSDCVVIGIDDPEWGQIVTAVVVSVDDSIYDGLREHCLNSLPGHKVPKLIKIISKIPQNELGKIQYELIREFLTQ